MDNQEGCLPYTREASGSIEVANAGGVGGVAWRAVAVAWGVGGVPRGVGSVARGVGRVARLRGLLLARQSHGIEHFTDIARKNIKYNNTRDVYLYIYSVSAYMG